MTRKLRAVIPAILCVALAASACSKKEETPTLQEIRLRSLRIRLIWIL